MPTRLLILVSSLAALLVPRGLEACSMCHCGDPTFTLVGSQIFLPRAWSLGIEAGRYAKDQAAADDPTTPEKETEDRYTLSAAYSVGRRLTLIARLPFSERTISTVHESSSLTGVSDPELLAHFRLVAAAGRPGSWVSLTAGVKTPWGENDRQGGGGRAEEHLQPGTGAWGGVAGLTFSHLAGDEGALYGSVLGRVNGRNGPGYHYGNVLLANLAFEQKLAGRVNGVLEANFRYAGKDEVTLAQPDPNTGGSVLYLSPALLVRLDRNLFFRLGAQIPVVKHLRGVQDEKVNVLTGLTVRF